MDGKLSELKEKQAEIGDKISLLQETNKKKDQETAEIRQLIAECRENLNRIKGIGTSPCDNPDEGQEGGALAPCDDREEDNRQPSRSRCQELLGKKKDCGSSSKKPDCGGSAKKSDCSGSAKKSDCSGSAKKSDCGGSAKKPDCNKKKKKGKERVSCKVDLNRMKVRIRGPSEDLKKLDATQLINLLEKFQCQELIINTGEEMVQDPGEIRLIYFLHPGNIVMVAGIIMIAFLINTNICQSEDCGSAKPLFKVLYVGSSAFHYGMVLWMIFIRGYALRFGLNHDTFHLVDNIILPKYFSVCVLLGALSLYTFLATHPIAPCSSWPLDVVAQIVIIGLTFFMELITLCYLIPALIKLRDASDDYVFEEDETECNVPQSYGKNLVKLRKISWTLCLINFITLLLLGANIYFITAKLNVGQLAN